MDDMKDMLKDRNTRENIKLAMLVERVVIMLQEDIVGAGSEGIDEADLINKARQWLKEYHEWLRT